jgi:hypothetical protein
VIGRSWSGLGTCVLLAVSLVCCKFVPGDIGGLSARDLAGTWEAKYDGDYFDRRCGYRVTGVETLNLRADGTYQQVYADGEGYVYTGPWSRWYVEHEGGVSVLHLVGGRFYPLGIVEAERLARGQLICDMPDYSGGRIILDGSQIVLYAYGSSLAPGGIILRHLEVCDPDSPAIVDFWREVKGTSSADAS